MFVNYSMYKFLPILLFAYGLAITTDDIYDNSYALIIGIDKYENVSNLDYAVKDANSITTLLRNNFNFPSKNIQTLLNEEATYSNIRNSLSEISSSAKANDRVLIYFAGHGMTKDLPDGGEMGYLLPVDGIKDNLYASAIPMNDLKDLSYMSKAKHMLFLVDACYGGLAAVGKRGLDATNTTNYIKKVTNIKSRQIITAGGKAEQVIEKPEWGHSAYTMNLLRGLRSGLADSNEDGYITADELGDYLTEKVTIDSDNQQTPQSRRLTSHEGEFVFVASDNEYSPLKYDKDNNTKDSDGVTLPLPSDWGTVSVKDRLKKRMDEKSWSADPTGFGEGYFGCIDSSASNYNPEAYEDDGSCTYIDYKNNNFNYSKCLDIDASVYPDDCISAVHKFGCDYSWGGSLIRDLCSKTCGSCPARIKLSIGDYETKIIAHRGGLEEDYSTIEILIESDTPIAGFQFDVTGVTDIDVSGGMAEEAGFVLSTGANVILGYSLAGYTIPIGKGVLVVLDISSPIGNTFEICIENITLSSSQGELLEFEVDNCKKIK